MKMQTRYGAGHQNTGGVARGLSPALQRSIAATQSGGNKAYPNIARAIAATPKMYGGKKSNLAGLAIAGGVAPKVRAPWVPPQMARIPLDPPIKYRVSPKVLKKILQSGNPLSMYRSLLGDALGQLVNYWYSPQGGLKYTLRVPPARQSCYSYKPMALPSPDCGMAEAMYVSANSSQYVMNCGTWHYPAQAGPFGPVQEWSGYIGRGLFVAIGPVRGGIYGCHRMDFAHVWQFDYRSSYPTGKIVPARRAYPGGPSIPEPAPLSDPIFRVPYGGPEKLGLDNKRLFPRRKPVLKPYQMPASTISVGSGGSRYIPTIITHDQLPPSPGKKEKKRQIPQGLITKYYGPFTEALDALEAIEDSLPPGMKSKDRTLPGRIAFLLRNWRYIRPIVAADNLARNHLQDAAIGKIGNLQKKGIQNASRHGYWRSLRGASVSRLSGGTPRF